MGIPKTLQNLNNKKIKTDEAFKKSHPKSLRVNQMQFPQCLEDHFCLNSVLAENYLQSKVAHSFCGVTSRNEITNRNRNVVTLKKKHIYLIFC